MTESQTTHTPGPWLEQGGKWISDRVGTMVADVHTVNTRHRSGAECAANCRLIASAPELLAALKAMTEMMDLWMVEPHLRKQVIPQARAAIAKATGSS